MLLSNLSHFFPANSTNLNFFSSHNDICDKYISLSDYEYVDPDYTIRSVHSDLNLHGPRKVRVELCTLITKVRHHIVGQEVFPVSVCGFCTVTVLHANSMPRPGGSVVSVSDS